MATTARVFSFFFSSLLSYTTQTILISTYFFFSRKCPAQKVHNFQDFYEGKICDLQYRIPTVPTVYVYVGILLLVATYILAT